MKSTMVPDFKSLLHAYLSAYWLRPVTALVRALEATSLELWREPVDHAVELACGDGINSLIARGGGLDDGFDAFKSVPLVRPESFFGGRLDVYDTDDPASADNSPELLRPSRQAFWQAGLDHKMNLLRKAQRLRSFQGLVLHDLNLPLPMRSDSVSFIFSNSIYWVENAAGLLSEIHRVLRPGGTGKFVIINPRFRDHMAWRQLEPYSFKRLLDSGRHLHYKTVRPHAEWETMFRRAGFNVDRVIPTFNDSLVHMIEFHDYREISPLTAFMSRRLRPEDRRHVKDEWVRYAEFIFLEMYEDRFLDASAANHNYGIFVVSKGTRSDALS